jgi:Amt family ammonium transporter
LTALTEASAAICFILILLVPLAGAALALINAGLSRSRSAAHAMVSALLVFSVASLVYFAVGFSWQGYTGRPAHALLVAGKSWNWIGSERFLFRGLEFDGSPASLAPLLGMLGAGLAAMIPLGSGADRWRMGASCASAAVLAGWTYPVFAHWAWGGGWLAQLGANYGLGRGFIDSGGAGSIQVIGGLTALSITWILGPRRGKFSSEAIPAAIPGHNAVLVVFGCFLAWIGWMGLDGAGSILFTGLDSGHLALVGVNATLGAATAALAAAVVTRVRFGKPDGSLCANGWVGGLVASSAGCATIRPAGAVGIGLIAGVLVVYSVEWIELHLTVDDPGGAISVHAVAGLWGILAAGIFSQSSDQDQWLAQFVGAATLVGFVLPMTYALNLVVNRFYPQRVAPEGERQGLDLFELGAGAYPEFTSHSEDSWPR